jgi:lipopolysaccharide biosynthesis glycosyltransferase
LAPYRIFIGFDKRMPIASDVLAYSLRKHSSVPLDIRFLKLDELDLKRTHDPLQSTEFTYTRFLVPHLCGFKGTALFMDNDMLAFGDIAAVFKLDMSDYWLRCVKHEQKVASGIKMDGRVQTSYPRKNWSSFMLLNCEKMTAWTKEAVETKPASWLHRFEPVPDDKIGDIPPVWNTLDWYDDKTQLIHYTEGGPWFERCKDHAYGKPWFQYRDEFLAQSQAKTGRAG